VTIPTAGGHPDADALADFAAEVLPAWRAEELEAHVRTCPHCTGLLAEAERVRGLLRAVDPGPMPADVAARLDAAVTAEWARRTPGSDEADAWPPRRVPARPSGSGRPLSRPVRSTQRTRRQVREEERDDARPGRSRRWLALAAGVIVVAGLGGLAARELGTGPSTSSGGASAESAGGTAATPASTTPILATGTDYGPDTLDAQVKALLATSRKASLAQAAPRAADQSADASGGKSPTPLASPSGALRAGEQSLRDPAALQGCLKAIDAAGVRPLAVDLATYQGRAAAILVLPGREGGYEVWAVARDCRPGADGTLHFAAVHA
jgi:hypothetical protein